MDVEERDRSKDGSNSANATIFNLSIVRRTACMPGGSSAVHTRLPAGCCVMTRFGSS
jgi:hypothetical protein